MGQTCRKCTDWDEGWVTQDEARECSAVLATSSRCTRFCVCVRARVRVTWAWECVPVCTCY